VLLPPAVALGEQLGEQAAAARPGVALGDHLVLAAHAASRAIAAQEQIAWPVQGMTDRTDTARQPIRRAAHEAASNNVSRCGAGHGRPRRGRGAFITRATSAAVNR
jgi:hypothetical protein